MTGQEPGWDLQLLCTAQPISHGGFGDYRAPTAVSPAGKHEILSTTGPPSNLAKTQLLVPSLGNSATTIPPPGGTAGTSP